MNGLLLLQINLQTCWSLLQQCEAFACFLFCFRPSPHCLLLSIAGVGLVGQKRAVVHETLEVQPIFSGISWNLRVEPKFLRSKLISPGIFEVN